MTRRYHREGNGRRSRQYPHLVGSARRTDAVSQFAEAGFVVLDWNRFRLVVKNRTYTVAPGRNDKGQWGHKITGRTIAEPPNGGGLWFPSEIEPARIARYLSNLADNPVEAD